jgi:hypothetical protein
MMMRKASAAASSLLLLLGAVGASAASGFPIRMEGKILRKSSDKLVLSLAEFEFSGQREVRIRNRKTGEEMGIPMASVYHDISYTEPISPKLSDSLDIGEWIPYVEWVIPDTPEALRDRLTRIYEYQNELRRELGSALLEGGDPEIKVTSRVTLNKIEKFHRIASRIARRFLSLVREKDEVNRYLVPLKIEIGYNPLTSISSRPGGSSARDAREVIYWEVHRVLTQHFQLDDSLVDTVFDAPTTIRRIRFIGAKEASSSTEFPSVTIMGKSIHSALYLQRQGFVRDVMLLVRLKRFSDPFIKDRLLVDRLVNEGTIVEVEGRKVAVTFIPPFMKKGETLFIEPGGEGGKGIPIVLDIPLPAEGYTLTKELPEDEIDRIRPGMPVVRR